MEDVHCIDLGRAGWLHGAVNTPDLPILLRRHEWRTRILFAAFGAAVGLVALMALTVDMWLSHRSRMALADDRFMAGSLFAFGAFNVLVSAAIRVCLPMFLRGKIDRAGLANASMACTILAGILCATPAVFGLIYVLAGGDTPPAAFFGAFALTCLLGHYVGRVRP